VRNINKTFAERLAAELEIVNLTQKEFSEKVGVTEATISRYLTGNRTPRMEILSNIAKVLKISIDDLLYVTEISNKDFTVENNLNEALNNPNNKEIFAKRLIGVLYKNDMSQSELAKKLNITKSTVSKYTTGVNYPDTEKLILMAELLNVSIDYLLGLTDDEELQKLRKFKEEIIKYIENDK